MAAEPRPGLSVVIPTFNRRKSLDTCLEALARCDRPPGGFEVIVVDDGGAELLDPGLPARFEALVLRVLRVPHAGPGTARNAGLRLAQGERVVFTDDDCTFLPDALRVLAALHARHPDHLILGHVANGAVDNVYAVADDLLHQVVYAHFNAGTVREPAHAGAALSAPSQRLRELGGFDERFDCAAQEDRELVARWMEREWPILFAPRWRVEHWHRHALHTYVVQHYRYGRGAWRFHWVRAQRGAERRVAPDLGFYLRLFRAGTAAARRKSTPLLALLPPLCTLATLAGFGTEAMRHVVRVAGIRVRAGRVGQPVGDAEGH